MRAIHVRAPRFAFDAIPRGWLATDPLASDVVDALSLVFPEGERFFIRSVLHFADVYENDPELRARVRAFVGQEGRHGHEHDRMNRALAARGHDVERFLRLYRKLGYEVFEPRTPPHLRLAMTAALEHMTATLAEVALGTHVLDDAHPELARMLRWHAAEEIEHRAVAFDVLTKVDPRLRTRIVGIAGGSAMLVLFFGLALASLRREDGGLEVTDRLASRRFWNQAARAMPRVARALARYTARDFHPDEAHIDPVMGERVEKAFRVVLGDLAGAQS
jgi:predicted metal-dependent hydrolase